MTQIILSRREKLQNHRGIALVAVLLMTVVLLALAGAFFINYRSDLALMGSSVYREQTKNACMSIADLLEYKLQNDKTFGIRGNLYGDPYSTPTPIPKTESYGQQQVGDSQQPVVDLEYSYDRSNMRKCLLSGSLPGTQVEFEAVLVNNFKSNVFQRDDGTGYSNETPPQTARAWITATRGNITSHINVIFKQSPFTDSTIISGGQIDFDLTESDGNWTLGSMQSTGNAVRAKTHISSGTLEVADPAQTKLNFIPPPGLSGKLKAPYGILQSETIRMKVDGVAQALQADDPITRSIEKNIKGTISTGNGEFKVPTLNANDLKSARNQINFPYSHLSFDRSDTAEGKTVYSLKNNGNVLASYETNEDGQLLPGGQRYFSWQGNYGQGGFGGGGGGGGSPVVFDLENRTMTVPPDSELNLPDNFTLESGSGFQPTVILGNAQQGSILNGKNVNIQGSIGGSGGIKADGTITVAAKSALSTTPDFGIALHADGDIELKPPVVSKSNRIVTDFDAFAQTYRTISKAATKEKLNDWAYLDPAKQNDVADAFQTQILATPTSSDKFSALWDGLTNEFSEVDEPNKVLVQEFRDTLLRKGVDAVYEDVETPPVDTSTDGETGTSTTTKVLVKEAIPPGPGVTLEDYVRMREFFKTAQEGHPDPSWLSSKNSDDGKFFRSQDVSQIIHNQLNNYQNLAGQETTYVKDIPVFNWKPLGRFFESANPDKAVYAQDMAFRGLIYTNGNLIFDAQRKGIYLEGALVAHKDITIKDASGGQFIYNSDLLQNLFRPRNNDESIPLKRTFWAYY